MPIELLEKIISFAIPDTVQITIPYSNTSTPRTQLSRWGRGWPVSSRIWKQSLPFEWTPKWLHGLLLVSKDVRQIARKILVEHVDFDIRPRSASKSLSVPTDVHRRMVYVRRVFMAGE
jgi:hypothetical protein